MIGAISGLIIPVLAIVAIVFGIRRLRSSEGRNPIQGHTVRRFFQYLLLYALLIVGALGLSGLLGRALDTSSLVVGNQTDLARNLSFAVVGIPLYIVLALWTRRKFAEDQSEAKSFAWGLYTTLTCLTSLVIGMFALHEMVAWAVRTNDYRGSALARLIVWGAVWGSHWWIHLRVSPAGSSRAHHLLGSLIALGTVVVGFDQLISAAMQRAWHFGGDTLFPSQGNLILKGAATLIVGAPVWYLYWIRNYSKSTRDPLWIGYVLLVGVGGGIVMAVVSASTVLYSTLVWLIGDSGPATAAIHFQNVPVAAGLIVVGTLTWWYHHAVLEAGRVETGKAARTEVQRIYEYLMSGVGLLAAAGGVAMILVALLEAWTSSAVIAGSGAKNALLAAATLLIVGGPVWGIYWRRIQRAVKVFPSEEHLSPTRRVYLFILFGLGGIVAVVTLLVGVFFLFDDIFKGNFGIETLRRIRFALSILMATAAIATYHWFVYRSERGLISTSNRGPKYVLLIGQKDAELVHSISRLTGGRVQSWLRTDEPVADWPKREVLELLEDCKEESVVVLADSKGVQVIPTDRSH